MWQPETRNISTFLQKSPPKTLICTDWKVQMPIFHDRYLYFKLKKICSYLDCTEIFKVKSTFHIVSSSFSYKYFPLILSLQRRWWPGRKWCRDRYLTLRWRRAPCPAWARWRASRPPRSPISSSWPTSTSWEPCCPRCISWGGWERDRWPSSQRWVGMRGKGAEVE